jgi:hypothetical protein
MLMSILDEPGSPSGLAAEVPEGSTVMDVPVVPPPGGGEAKKDEKAKAPAASTSNAAKAILEKYMRRPRKEG